MGSLSQLLSSASNFLRPAIYSARIGLLAQVNSAALKIRKDALTNFFLFTRMMPLPGGPWDVGGLAICK